MSNEPKKFVKGIVFRNISDAVDASDTNPTCNISGHTWVIDTVTTQTAALVSSACTVCVCCNKFVLACHGLSNNQLVKLTTSCAVPTGLTAYTACNLQKYYIVGVCANDFQVSATRGGCAVALTGTGTGTQTFTVMEEQAQMYLCSGAEKIVTDSNQLTLSNKTLSCPTFCSPVINGCVSGTGFLDEDAMCSNSATKVASQQSIKAYVDSQVTAQDLDFTADDCGTGAIDLDSQTLDIAGGDGISTTACAQTATVNVCITSAVDKAAPIAADELLLADSAAAGAIKKADIASISGSINHDCTSGFVANEHIDHSSVCVSAGSGLTGGGDISASRTLNVGAGDGVSVGACCVAVCITCATDKAAPVAGDEILIADSAAAGAIKKADVASFSGAINHDCTSGFVADEHIAHSCVCVIAGNGLTGGGDISASRTLDVAVTACELAVSACAVGLAPCAVMPGTGAVTVPDGTVAQRPACASNGMFRYNTCCSAFEGYANCAWGAIGGGGSGSKDIFYQEDFEGIVDHTNFTSGNNATFDNGGCVSGTLATESCCALAECNSLKFTLTACSANDWIKSPAISIDDKQSGNFIGLNLYYTYTGCACDIKAIIYDNTGCSVLTSSTDVFVCACNPTRFSISAFVPSTSTCLAWGFQVVCATACAVLTIDDVELSTNPFVYKNLLDKQEVSLGDANGHGSSSTAIRRFTTTVRSDGSGIFTDSGDSSTLGREFTFLKKAIVNISYSDLGTSTHTFGISLNSNQLTTSVASITKTHRRGINTTDTANFHETASATFIAEVGDVVRPHTDGSPNGTSNVHFSITAIAESEHVVTPASIGDTTTNILSADVTADGDVSDLTFTDLTIGNTYLLTGVIKTNSANSAIDLRYRSAASDTGTLHGSTQFRNFDTAGQTGETDSVAIIFTADSTSLYTYYDETVTTNASLSGDGTRNETFLQLTNITAQFQAAIPTTLIMEVDIIDDTTSENSTAQSITGSTSYQTITVNQIDGDTSFGSLSSNQITLQPGKYKFDHHFVGRNSATAGLAYVQLYDATNTTGIAHGVSFADTDTQPNVSISRVVTITTATTYEYRARVANSATSWSIYSSRGTITKIK